ncbi:MAG: DUF5050 domain-containing protein [Roseburia sp.]|nr:DUF5050 domain-containing protein [Roseburia sp.]
MINKRMEKAGSIVLILLCMGIFFGYASGHSDGNIKEKQEAAEVFLSGEELVEGQQETEEEAQVTLPEEEQETEEFPQVMLTEEEQEIIENTWANSHRSRIAYMDGYYYYSSQLDHYYLYRVKEDGSEPQCLAKIHPGSICVQDGYVYFINQSDGHGIYRIMADGTRMEKLCENGHNLQISDDYVFFCSSAYEETLETTGVIVEGQKNGGLYRMKKDGSERELIAEDVWDYVLSNGYSQETQSMDIIYYSKTEKNGMTAYKMVSGQGEEVVCHFDVQGNLAVFGRNLYCIGKFYGDTEKLTRFCLGNREMSSFGVPEFMDCCIYKGYFYGLYLQSEEQEIYWNIYRLNLNTGDSEIVHEDTLQRKMNTEDSEIAYEDTLQGESWPLDLYATENGIFFRRFVSEEEGNQWFHLTKDGDIQEFEDRENIPVTLPADYAGPPGEVKNVVNALDEMSTEGYETYLSEGLEYEEYFSEHEYGGCVIDLLQFNSKIAGHQQINAYLQNVYQEALQDKDAFFEMLDTETPQDLWKYSQYTGYNYIYIGEEYITVGILASDHPAWSRSRDYFQPVTFDRASGEEVSLEEILGMTTQEAVARLTGAVYKYEEGKRNEDFFLEEGNLLTNKYEPDNFLLFSEGLGIYYWEGAIGPNVAGDFLFIIPWEDAVGTS